MKVNVLVAVAGVCVVGLAVSGCGGSDYGTASEKAQQEFRQYCDRLEGHLFPEGRKLDKRVSSPFVEIIMGKQVATALIVDDPKQYDVTFEKAGGDWSLLEARTMDAEGGPQPADEATMARFRKAIEAANAE